MFSLQIFNDSIGIQSKSTMHLGKKSLASSLAQYLSIAFVARGSPVSDIKGVLNTVCNCVATMKKIARQKLGTILTV